MRLFSLFLSHIPIFMVRLCRHLSSNEWSNCTNAIFPWKKNPKSITDRIGYGSTGSQGKFFIRMYTGNSEVVLSLIRLPRYCVTLLETFSRECVSSNWHMDKSVIHLDSEYIRCDTWYAIPIMWFLTKLAESRKKDGISKWKENPSWDLESLSTCFFLLFCLLLLTTCVVFKCVHHVVCYTTTCVVGLY